jgi:glycosyltransferase involved in cell wall biosynthesis
MKILFVTMQYGRSYLQGTERYLGTLGRGLRAHGHEVGYLAGDPLHVDRRQLGFGELVDPSENLYALPTRGWMALRGLGPERIVPWLRAWRPDVVHLANPAHVGVGIAGACRELGSPLIVTTMDFWWVCPKATLLRPDGQVCPGRREWQECIRCLAASHGKGWVKTLSRWPRGTSGLILAAFYAKAATRGMTPRDLGRWTQRNAILSDMLAIADHVIFPSRATSDAIRPCFTHDRYQVIPYGLSDEWFASPRPRPSIAKPPADLVIGFAGALMRHKGPHVLLEAIQKLGWKQTKIRLAGPSTDAAYTDRLRALAAGLNVEFMGPVSPENMPAFLRGLDLLAMTSVWPENLPFVVLEAQAAGVPVMASRLAGVADQVGDDRLLFAPGSSDGMAVALAAASANLPDLRPGKVSTAEEMTLATQAIYADAIQRRQAPPTTIQS